ncbi:MAG: glycolate oxidase subunit GlcF [Alphaproteobacteria bacterium]
MQTNFTQDQLKKPDVSDAARILRNCVHCGFCNATCPTYMLLGDELDGPRGRIYLIKGMLEEEKPASPELVKHIDRCLSCLSCTTTCPSGVDYMHLIDQARAHIDTTYQRSRGARLLRGFLALVLPRRALFRAVLWPGFLLRPLAPLLRAIPGLGWAAAMLELAPGRRPAVAQFPGAAVIKAQGFRCGRVVVMRGCAQSVLKPSITDATVRLLIRQGYEVVLAGGEGCCGALVHHMGREEEARATARKIIDIWSGEQARAGLDAIIINASGCGTTVKDYGHLLRNDPDYAGKARQIAGMAKDIHEFLDTMELGPMINKTGLSVAYHAPCSLQHGQAIRQAPRALLSVAGFEVKSVAQGHICCGSAGTYNILQPKIARQLRDLKVANLLKTKADLVATGNIGCMTQITSSLKMPVVHTVELLDWATGGPVPRELGDLVAAKAKSCDQPS